MSEIFRLKSQKTIQTAVTCVSWAPKGAVACIPSPILYSNLRVKELCLNDFYYHNLRKLVSCLFFFFFFFFQNLFKNIGSPACFIQALLVSYQDRPLVDDLIEPTYFIIFL